MQTCQISPAIKLVQVSTERNLSDFDVQGHEGIKRVTVPQGIKIGDPFARQALAFRPGKESAEPGVQKGELARFQSM